MPPPISGHIFISYSRKDDAVMRKVAFHLRDLNLKVWVDHEKLIPGTPAWEDSIEKAIKNAYAIVALLSPEAKDSEWVRREIAYADQYQKRIFPVIVRGDDDSAIPIRLITRQFIDLRLNEDKGLDELSAALIFFIEKKQTLEMKRSSDKQETSAVHSSSTSPRKAQPAQKWILPVGISLAVCTLVLGTLWVGYRVFSPSRTSTSAPSDNIDVISTTALSTEAPDQSPTEADTPIPDISTSTDDMPLEYLNDVEVFEVDSFDDPSTSQWNIINGGIDNGVLQIIGNNNFDGVYSNREFREGEGAIIDFNYSEGAVLELFMDHGQYNDDSYKRFGIYIDNNSIVVNERGGGNTDGSGLIGNLAFEPNTTYSLLIAILPNGEFLQVLWDPSNPSKNLSYRETLDQTWAGINWIYFLQAGSGTINFDNFKAIRFSGAK